MSEQQFAFLVSELTRLSYECEQCKTSIIFDVVGNQRRGVPRVCPSCHADIEQLALVIDCYQRFYNEAVKLKTFQLRTKPTTVKE